MPKFITIIRDISFLLLFLVCSKYAFERSIVHMQQEKPSPWKKLDIHKLDKCFLAAIKATKQQIKQTISIVENKNINQNLQNMNKEITQIEEKYKKNSPATYLLGPIGTAAIVLKEKKLEQELLGIIKNLEIILSDLQQDHHKESALQNIEISSIESGIIKNKDLLGQIPRPSIFS